MLLELRHDARRLQVTPAGSGAATGSSAATSRAVLSSRSPRNTGARRMPSEVRSENLTCATSSGLTHVIGPSALPGDPAPNRRHLGVERRLVDSQRLQPLVERRQRLVVEARAGVADIGQLGVARARSSRRAASRRCARATRAAGVAADDELLAVGGLDLEPRVGALARLVAAVPPLGHDALQAAALDRLVERHAVLGIVSTRRMRSVGMRLAASSALRCSSPTPRRS